MRAFLFLLALCPQLALAVNLFLADCGIGTISGHPTWSRSREVFVYEDGNNNVKDPNEIVVLPWGNGTYPWGKSGVTVQFPDDTNWTFIINNDIPDYSYVGYGIHTDADGGRLDTLFCFADHNIDLGMSGTQADYGCLSAFMCRPQPPPVACPPMDSSLPTSYPTSSSSISTIPTTWTTSSFTSVSSETATTTVTTFVSTIWTTITATQSFSDCLPPSTTAFTSTSSVINATSSISSTFVSSVTNSSAFSTVTNTWSSTSLRPTFSITANSTTGGATGSGSGTGIWPTGTSTGSGTGTSVWPTGTASGTGTGVWSTRTGTGTGTGVWPTGTGTGTGIGTGGPGSPEPTERQLTVKVQAHPRQVRVERPWSAIIQQAYFDIWGNCRSGSAKLAGETSISYQCSGSNITGYGRKTIVPVLIDALYRAGQQNAWISQDGAYTTLPITVSIAVSDGTNQAYVNYALTANQDKYDYVGGQCVACNTSLFTLEWDKAIEDAFAPVPGTISMIEVDNSCQPTEHCIKPGVALTRGARFWWW